ncbi:Melibiose operon regulatory protein [Caprobacter fermentans]|uniref:AraC family transcriptional regulator n=1 Tax=Caproicibacter fermentans TaxID=2576756 RepID=A0A6N8HXE0_9FIRM|nr:AraC family transcriptional regulator [Caproicibacter fermentans]MVB10524.1 Melibiose operon regulatory protein [Caproicibacter fermentans]OCN01324.1 hypothetical protein A7X67_02085 [Clostridium sp. W14A]QNK40123.1 AraC family transcriptional regulator [Caproicibacter fermentans]
MKTFHMHKKYEIYYLAEGARKYFIDDSVYPVNAGNIVIIGPDEIHKTASSGDAPHTRYVLNFNPEYFGRSWDWGFDPFSFFSLGIKVLTVSMKLQGLFESIFQRLYDLNGRNSPEAVVLRRALLAELLITLKSCAEEQAARHENSEKLSNKTVDRIIAFILKNYTSQLNLKGIAAQFYISPYYLSHLFKKTTNLSVVEYINSVRIRAAKKLLETTGCSISSIATKTGFNTSAHFSRMFKLGTGMSPTQYRRYYSPEHKDKTANP